MSKLSLFEISRAEQDALEELLEAEETLLAVQSTRNAPADDLQVAKDDYEAALLDLETIADARGKKLEKLRKVHPEPLASQERIRVSNQNLPAKEERCRQNAGLVEAEPCRLPHHDRQEVNHRWRV